MACFINLKSKYTLISLTRKLIVPFLILSIEILIVKSSYITQEKSLLDLRRGGNDLRRLIIKILLIWIMFKNSKSTKRFQPKPINYQHFGRQGHQRYHL